MECGLFPRDTRRRVCRVAPKPIFLPESTIPMSRRPLVVVPDFLTETNLEQRVLDGIADLRFLHSADEGEVIRQTPDADVLIFFHEVRLTDRSFAQLPRCKGMIRCGVGVDNIDVRAAGARGIVVCNVPDYG